MSRQRQVFPSNNEDDHINLPQATPRGELAYARARAPAPAPPPPPPNHMARRADVWFAWCLHGGLSPLPPFLPSHCRPPKPKDQPFCSVLSHLRPSFYTMSTLTLTTNMENFHEPCSQDGSPRKRSKVLPLSDNIQQPQFDRHHRTLLLVKKLSENATIPTRGSSQAAGYDLYRYAALTAELKLLVRCHLLILLLKCL